VGLDVRVVVLTPWPDEPGPVERSNRDTIAALAGVRVSTLVRIPVSPRVAPTGLPVTDWLPELGEQPAPRMAAGQF
jgi:hypothetical protein